MAKFKNVLFGVLLLFSQVGLSQQNTPPSPAPPPPGLPLPIDDYIPLLMFAGILLGIFWIQKMKKA